MIPIKDSRNRAIGIDDTTGTDQGTTVAQRSTKSKPKKRTVKKNTSTKAAPKKKVRR